MMILPYDRISAVEYAKNWAMKRNPLYYNFDGQGGDCTNFISQCIYAGSRVMNYTKDTGWYYNSPSDRAAAWSAAQYLYNFLISNKGAGPYAVSTSNPDPGDIILLNNGDEFYHSLIISGFENGVPLVCAHTDDSLMRPLDTYYFSGKEILHIDAIRK